MMPGHVNGFSLGYTALGAIVMWSGIKGWSISQTFRNLVQGKTPTTNTEQISTAQADLSTGTSIPGVTVGIPAGVAAPGGSAAQNQALGKLLAQPYGWSSGPEWTALNNVVEAESGWSDTVANSSSGAAGIAQNINGFSSSYQSGNAQQQIAWLLSYIKGRYGDPIAAWNFHVANGWY